MGNVLEINFHGDRLTAVSTDDRGVVVALRPLVTGMGLNWSGQLQRVRRDPILSEAVCVIHTGSEPAAVCLPLDLIPGFLFRIDANRVDEAVRPKVIDYQKGCFRALADACLPPTGAPRPAEPILLPAEAVTLPEARKLVTEARMSFGERAARQLWLKTGLPTVPAMFDVPRQASLFQGEFQREVAGGQP